jgi:hypothetical protein
MFTLLLVAATGLASSAAPPVRAEERGLAYLAREVPRWAKKHHCYSCHHNGDAARALLAGVRLGWAVPRDSLADTTRWLARPGSWDHNGGEGPFSDKKLARLQFAASLADARAVGLVKERAPLDQAARLVADLQGRDGSWPAGEETLGSPATHGTALATHLARRTLLRADPRRYRTALARADAWLRKAPIGSTLDAAAVLLALGKSADGPAVAQRRRCLEMVRKAQSRSGGWGPYPDSPPEVFDTAVVLLALAGLEPTAEVRSWIRRGRAYLRDTQESDGGWPETTRPAGGRSHAQRLSTTGWAVQALLAMRPARPARER